jgi:L,D-peptidoglycan transpeptidase YkuD (ErfK/YbiS/YcfS/YnhG family)
VKDNPRHIFITPRGARFGQRHYPCSIGRNGTTSRKKEGDGATPEGVHEIIGLLYRPDRIAKPTDWAIPLKLYDLWSDDVKDPDYNMIIRAPSEFGNEKLWRSDPLYDLVLLTNWNWPYAVKGRGSAIFLHQCRKPGHPTEGCVAFHKEHLLEIAKNITFGTKLIVSPNRHGRQK